MPIVITGLSAERMLQIESASIIKATRSGDNLILETKGGTQFNLGNIKGNPGTMTQAQLETTVHAVVDAKGAYGVATAPTTLRGSTIGFFGATGSAKPAALPASSTSAVDTVYGTEEAAVINNLRSRLNALESRLQGLGLIT